MLNHYVWLDLIVVMLEEAPSFLQESLSSDVINSAN